MGLTLSSGRYALAGQGHGFNPRRLGVVSAWFDVAGATNAGAGLAFTLPNSITPNNATTSIDARKPTIGTAANGVPILTCNASALSIPLHAGINGAQRWGIGFHIRLTSDLGNPVPCSIDSAGNSANGASTRKLVAQRFSGDRGVIFQNATESRAFGPATLWPLNTWVYCTMELNLGLESSPGVPAPEADRAVWTIDGLPVVSTFSAGDGALATLPTSMPVPTGNANLLSQNLDTGSNGLVGQIGRHIMYFDSAMAGVTSGLLTPSARASLSNLDRPA